MEPDVSPPELQPMMTNNETNIPGNEFIFILHKITFKNSVFKI